MNFKKMSFIAWMFFSFELMGQEPIKEKEIQVKLLQIEEEIKCVEKASQGSSHIEVYQTYMEQLEVEKAKYKKLLNSMEKSSSKSRDIRQDPAEKKTFSTVQSDALKKLQTYKDDTVPLEKRYELIIKELSATKEFYQKLNETKTTDSAASQSYRTHIRAKIEDLEKLKLDYELRIIKTEQNELADMRKTGVRVGAMLDVYYQWDFNRPAKKRNDRDIPFKNYNTKHNDFTIQLAEINILKTFKNLDFYLDLDFGEMPEQNKSHSADPISHHLGQAFLRYRMPEFENTNLTVGKFYSHFGYEVPKAVENRTYSRPFYFTMICPFWHEGISLTKTGIGPFGGGLYVYDKTDDRVENNSGKTYGLQLNYGNGNLSGIYNFITGAEQNSNAVAAGSVPDSKEGDDKTMHELILTYNLSENLTLVLDAHTGYNKNFDTVKDYDTRWAGVVGYVDFKSSIKNAINFRFESFKDLTSKNASTNLFSTVDNPVEPVTVNGYTLTNRYSLNNSSELRLELRYDTATEKIFPKNQSDYSKQQSTMTLAWLYSI